jgi:murein DD-endopeptidase MepM/ murein hydrolase activator NlpD
VAKHRADRRDRSGRRPSWGGLLNRRTPVPATSHARGRRQPVRGLPSTATVVGAAVLVITAGGAVTASQADAPLSSSSVGLQKVFAPAGALDGARGEASSDVLAGRESAVSRDSRREALGRAADTKLQADAEARAKRRDAALAAMAARSERRAKELARSAWQLPMGHGVYHLTGRFGDTSGLWSHRHTGLDFAALTGSVIHAVAAGTVTSTGYDGAYGNKTVVTLKNGTELWYCHQTAFAVHRGQRVLPGQRIGYVGSTGNVTGPHLHLEVRPGGRGPVDPYAALVKHDLRP